MEETTWLQDELERARELGLTVHVEGRVCKYTNPAELSAVLGEPVYMLDYVSDEAGKITGICFDKVNEDDLAKRA